MLMLGKPRRVLSRRLVAAVSAAAFLGLVFAAHAGATLFSAGVSPGTASAGATATYQVTIKNLLGPPLGWANVQVPTGWTDATVGTPIVRKSWMKRCRIGSGRRRSSVGYCSSAPQDRARRTSSRCSGQSESR